MKRIGRLPREILYFGGIGAYGFGIGIVYWLLTYETAGSILLTVFGAGAVGFALLLALSLRGRQLDGSGQPAPLEAGAEGPFGSVPGRVPANSLAPLEVGFGLAIVSLSFAFGVWMAIAGIVPLVAGGYAWIRSADRELRATRRDDPEDTDPLREGPAQTRRAGSPEPGVSSGRPAAEPPSG